MLWDNDTSKPIVYRWGWQSYKQDVDSSGNSAMFILVTSVN